MNRGELSVAIIKDKLTGDSRGFGFVEMPNKDEDKSSFLTFSWEQPDLPP